MKKSSYILKNLSIRKMPGFPNGMEPLKELASNVNIITGPNASGKSTTARAIQKLIWQNETKGLSIQGSVKIENDNWEIDIDSGRHRTERNGTDAELKGLPALEGHHRYLLALHNFIEGDENDLAKEIAKQSIGGFDLDAAQNDLGYSSRIHNLGISDYKNIKETEEKYRNTREGQRILKRDEESLALLKSDKEKAEEAGRLGEFYTKVEEYLEAKLSYTQLLNQIKEFPDSITKLTGKEYEDIQECEDQIEESKNKIDTAEKELDKCKTELSQLTISEDGIDEISISEIEERLAKLGSLEQSISNLRDQIIQEKTAETKAIKSIDPAIDPKEWRSIEINDVNGLDKMHRNAYQIIGEKKFIEAEIDLLSEDAKKYNSEKQASDIFTFGIKTLAEWLKEPIEANGIPLKTVILISSFAIIAAISTYFIGWFGVVIGVALFIIALFITKSSKGSTSNTLSVRESDFKKSGLTPPTHWNTENVAKRIDELIVQLSAGREAERIAQRLTECKTKLQQLQIRMDALNTERQQWIEKLQSAPGFPSTTENDFSSLYWFLTNVMNWQKANIQRLTLEEKLEKSDKEFDDELEKVNALFLQSNLLEADDLISAKSSFSKLKYEENIRKNLTRNALGHADIIKNEKGIKLKSNEKLLAIYQTIGIDEKDKEEVQELVKQLSGYQQIARDVYSSEQAFLRQKSQLEAHSLFKVYAEEIEDLAIDEAKEKATQNKEIAKETEGIQKKITEIETIIQTKKKGHELEDLLTKKEENLDALHELYESNLSSLTGDLIISELKKETQNKNRPEVFQKANEIFSKITLGRYSLKLNERDNVSFEAIDNVLNRSYNLSELSTGTRVQLLLAVRLAYVETVESSIKLPLLADELLANSDDNRAKAIIEALIEISRQGRQVFYFTAQADEVGKWQSHLNQAALDYKVIQLSSKGNKTFKTGEFVADLSNFSLSQVVPLPKGENHREYGQLLSFQPFNLLIQNSSELPLWYVIEDLDLLYGALSKGIKTWGQLERFFKNNGKIDHLNESNFSEYSKLIEILNKFQELHKIGRSLLIGRSILQDSGAISDIYIDRVSDKLDELKGDPKQLLHSLRNKGVPGFRTSYADELESYLLTEGYIDDKEILDADEIMIRMQALISNMEIAPQEVESILDRVLGR